MSTKQIDVPQTGGQIVLQQQRQRQQEQQIQGDLRKSIGCTLFVTALVFGCFNLAFIIPDLIYAYEGSLCVKTIPEGFTFNLSTWLQVDAYLRIGITALLILVVLCVCISTDAGLFCSASALFIIGLYGIFAMIWTIVGSVLFWGKLNPTGICMGGVHDYMYALLILSLIGTCCMIFSKCMQRNNQSALNV